MANITRQQKINNEYWVWVSSGDLNTEILTFKKKPIQEEVDIKFNKLLEIKNIKPDINSIENEIDILTKRIDELNAQKENLKTDN